MHGDRDRGGGIGGAAPEEVARLMSRGGLSNADWERRRRQRMALETAALKHRCPTCGAAPEQYCHTGSPFQLHSERRALAIEVR